MDPRMRFPSADHLIDIKRYPGLVMALSGDVVLAESRHTLLLREAACRPIFYFPVETVMMALLTRSPAASHCYYKGEASYFGVKRRGDDLADVAWCYDRPYPAVADLRGCVAFDDGRVTIEATPA